MKHNQKQAHKAVTDAIRHRQLPPAKLRLCVRCGYGIAYDWHHHRGYARRNWLNVIPLCRACHRTTHAKAKRAK